MGNTNTHLRVIAFAGVLILAGSIVFGLFQEARASDFGFVGTPATTVINSGTFTVELVIDQGKFVPIRSIAAVVEQQHPSRVGQTGVQGKLQSIAIAADECPMSPSGGMVCTSGDSTLTHLQGPTGVITQIQLLRVYGKTSGDDVTTGYTTDCAATPAKCEGFQTPGYGYDTVSGEFGQFGYGFGYGYAGGRGPADFNAGLGYGYDFDKLVFQFEVSISTTSLQNGAVHYLTVVADTGSGLTGSFSTPFHEFTARRGGGGGGGGSGGAGATLEGGPGTSFDVAAGQKFSYAAGTKVCVPDSGLCVTLAKDCISCHLEAADRGAGPPAGTPAVPAGFNGIRFIELTLIGADGNPVEGGVSGGTYEFTVDPADLPGNSRPAQVVMLRYNNGWRPLRTSCTAGDPITCTADLPGFSVFAVAVDLEAPTIADGAPTGELSQVTPTISASWTDNRAVDPSTLELTIDGESHGDDTGTLTVNQAGFSYIPGTGLTEGAHEVVATVRDASGLEGSETWSFSIVEPECPTPPTIVSVSPADGSTATLDDPVEVTVQMGTCPIVSTELTINGESVAATLTGGLLSVALPDTVEAGTVEVHVELTDSGGNTAARDWSYTATQAGDGEQPPEEGGGIPGWVWFLLIALVIVGVAAFLYYQQEQKKRGPGNE